LVVIGGGTAGLVTAAGAAGLGAKVALVERHLMGGDCLNYGCVPSKGIISAARHAAAMRDGAEFGVTASDVQADFATAMKRMRKLRSGISKHDSVQRFASLGIDVFLGQASFTEQNTVMVDGTVLEYHTAVIATGARASAPPISGLTEVPYLTNETLFSITELPKRLAVIGAGPIGCEMAQSFARFGSEVFVIEAMHGILPREDADASMIVLERMKRDGVKLLCCGKELKASKGEGDTVRLIVESHGQGYDITVDKLLVAVGRAPNVEGLNLEAAGVQYDKKGVKVDDNLRTANPRIFAAGDICSPYQFTHSADFMARIVIQNALFFGRKKASALTIPWVTYTSPEIAHVGLYEKDARERGMEVTTLTQPLSEVDRAILDGETEGFVRVLVRKGTDEILGATIVAEHAGEMISEITLAMTHKLGLGKIAVTMHPYPTQAEAIRKVADQYNRTRLTPRVKNLFTRLLAWRRGN
ncbi:MAG: mercuric reductase, partial [Prosthecobacter sp.]|nr:mercuric reductase [Prosthecobacter sp.]